MTKTLNKPSAIAMFVLPAFIVFTLIVIVSIAWVLGVSFFNWNGMGKATFVGLQNYRQLLFEDASYWEIVGNTFLYTLYELIWQVLGGFLSRCS